MVFILSKFCRKLNHFKFAKTLNSACHTFYLTTTTDGSMTREYSPCKNHQYTEEMSRDAFISVI